VQTNNVQSEEPGTEVEFVNFLMESSSLGRFNDVTVSPVTLISKVDVQALCANSDDVFETDFDLSDLFLTEVTADNSSVMQSIPDVMQFAQEEVVEEFSVVKEFSELSPPHVTASTNLYSDQVPLSQEVIVTQVNTIYNVSPVSTINQVTNHPSKLVSLSVNNKEI